jgi:mono/diheme cytochrome c family protein
MSKMFVGVVMVATAALFGVAVHAQGGDSAAAMKNPVPPTAANVTAGAATFKKYCSFCHGVAAQGNGPLAPEGSNPPDLTDGTWDHGSTDGDIFAVMSAGAAGTVMLGFKGKMPDQDMWRIVHYLRSVGPKDAAR